MNLFDEYSDPIKYKQNLLRTYKKIFSGTIKESFLAAMHEMVMRDPRYQRMMLNDLDPNHVFSFESVVCGKGFTTINVCKMIVMAHYFNSVDLSDPERGKLQESLAYRQKLLEDVLTMYSVEKLATNSYNPSSLEVYLPEIFYISALNNYLGNIYDEYMTTDKDINKMYDYDINSKMLYKIIIKIKACINLSDIGAIDELRIIFRTLIELFMTYVALWDQNGEVLKDYYNFDNASNEFNYNGAIPDKLKAQAKELHVNLIAFLNYGWLKNLQEFKQLSKEEQVFSLAGLARVLDIKYSKINHRYGSELYAIYRACNPQAHGTILMMNYFQLELHIFQNISLMLNLICEILSKSLLGINFKISEINLIELLNTANKKASAIYKWMINNNDALRKTNEDYRDRVICSIKMRN